MTGRCRTAMARSPSASRSALEAGLGMYAVGGGAPAIPGVIGQVRLGGRRFPASHRGPASGGPATRGHGHHPRLLLFTRLWLTSIFCGRSSSRPLRKRRSTTPKQLAEADGRLRPHRPRQSGRRRSCANGTCRAEKRRGAGRRAGPGCLGPAGGTAQFAAGSQPCAGGTDHRADRVGFARRRRRPTGRRRLVAPPGVGRKPPSRRRSGRADWIASGTRRSCPTCSWM